MSQMSIKSINMPKVNPIDQQAKRWSKSMKKFKIDSPERLSLIIQEDQQILGPIIK